VLNLKPFFERVGGYFKKELENNIRSQKGIDEQSFSQVTLATAKSRIYQNNSNRVKFKGVKGVAYRAKKTFREGKKNSVTPKDFKRLLFTGRFWQNAFKFTAYGESVKVFVNDSYYGLLRGRGGTTYADIVEYNNKGSARLNPEISNPPLIFPNNFAEVARMKAAKSAQADFNSKATQDEILHQIAAGIEAKTNVNITL